MQLSLAKSMILKRLGNPTNADMPETIEAEMALVQETVLEQNGRIVPWFMETELAQITLIPADERVTLPVDFVREKEGLLIYRSLEAAPWSKLTKTDYEELLEEYQDATGLPAKYALGGLYFRLRPIPDLDYVLKMFYYSKAPSVAGQGDSFENIWLKYAPDLLIGETAKAVALHILQDFDLAATFDTPIQRAWDRLMVETAAREEAGRSRNMGEPS